MFGFSPWILIGALAGSIAIAGGAYFKGDADAANRYQLKITKMQIDATAAAQKIRDALTAQANAAVATLEGQNAQARVVYRTIHDQVDRLVDRPVYRNVCLDTDGLMLVNAAIAGVPVAPAAPGNADGTMPQAITAH